MLNIKFVKTTKYNLKNLSKTMTKTLDLMAVSAVYYFQQHYMRIRDKYRSKLEYKTKLLIETINCGYR